MKKLQFWVYSALIYTASSIIFSLTTAAMFTPIGVLFYTAFLFIEFCTTMALTAIVLQRIVEFKARIIIIAITIIGWLPASLLSAWIISLAYPYRGYPYSPSYYDFSMFFSMGVLYTLYHSIIFCLSALIGTAIRVTYAERLKREILFTASRTQGNVDLLKLAVSLKDDPLNITDGVQQLIKEGHIVGYVDKDTNQLNINLPSQPTAASTPSAIQEPQGLIREYNIFKSLLIDLEELQAQDRISPRSYDALRQEYERRLRLLESAMSGSHI